MKTLQELKSICKEKGIKVSKKTLSWGPHLTFSIEGIDVEGVLTKEFYEIHKDAFESLEKIRKEFKGMTIDGQKYYGI